MQEGWKMNDIDEMDVHWYFEVMDFNNPEKKEEVFIDSINW